MASDERCPVCDRLACTRSVRIAEYMAKVGPSIQEGDEMLDAIADCDQHRVDWRSRALAAEAQCDSLESAIAQVTDDRDHERRVANEWLSQLHDANKRIAELEAALAAVTKERDRYRDAVHYLRRGIDGYDATFECCGVDDFKEVDCG